MHILRRSRLMLALVLLFVVGSLALAGCGVAELLPQFSHQGRLLDDDGNPVADGNYDVMYRLYHVASGGTAVYTDTQSVAVEDGLFTTTVGMTGPITPTIYAQPTWLEVTVEGETLTPRQRLLGAPYAFSLSSGAVAQGTETIDRTYLTFDDTGAMFTAVNLDATATGGHGILAMNRAAASGADRDKVAALQAIAAGGDGSSGAYGAIVRSENYRGLYAKGATGFYAALFDSTAGIGITGGGGCTGCTLAYNAQNVGNAPIAAGDFVAVTGVVMDTDLNIPIMQVTKANAASEAVVGVSAGSLNRVPVGRHYGMPIGGYEAADGPAANGGYLTVAVQGLVQARAGDASLQPGVTVAPGVDGVVAAAGGMTRALSAVDGNGMVWVMLGGQ